MHIALLQGQSFVNLPPTPTMKVFTQKMNWAINLFGICVNYAERCLYGSVTFVDLFGP
ncbi:hypothetical protein LguiA_003742 [Lonicera macranthoides]